MPKKLGICYPLSTVMGMLTRLSSSPLKASEKAQNQDVTKSKRGLRPRQKPNLSADEIRQKVAIQRSKKQASVKQAVLKQPQAETQELPETSAIDMNDPTSEKTQQKLRDVLSSGGFNFNPREREVLGQILNKG